MANFTYPIRYKTIKDLTIISNNTQDYVILSALDENNTIDVLSFYVKLVFFDEGSLKKLKSLRLSFILFELKLPLKKLRHYLNA